MFFQLIIRAAKVSFWVAITLVALWVLSYPVLLIIAASSGSPLEIPLRDILGLLPIMFGGLFGVIFLSIVVPQLLSNFVAKK